MTMLLFVLGCLVAGCIVVPALGAEGAVRTEKEGAASEIHSAQDCPVSTPPETRFIPPTPWPEYPPQADEFWYGTAGFWTALPSSGSWRQLALGEKFWFWSEAYSMAEDATPDIVLTAERLDGKATPFYTDEATNGYHESFGQAMLTGVTLASPGCWEFTAQYLDFEISFVLWVPE
jgi:hypothetical protein